MEMEIQFDPKTVEIPSSKGFRQGKWFHNYMHSSLVKGKFFFYITNCNTTENLPLELLDRLTKEAKYAANNIAIVVLEDQEELQERYKKASNVVFVTQGTEEFISNLATAGVVISDAILPAFYTRREGQIYVNVAEPSETDFDRNGNRLFIAEDNTVSNLLNATYLVAPNAAYTLEVYKEKYKLDGLFTGRIIERGEGQSVAELAEEMLALLLTGTSNLSLVNISEEKKHKILFVIDFKNNEDRDSWKYISILEEVDTKKHDVTVLLPTTPSKEKLEELKFIKNDIRIIMKSGRVNYDEESFISLAKLRHEFKYGNDIKEIMAGAPSNEFKIEWNRLLGNVSFDTACLVSPQTVYWDAMFVELESKKKVVFRNKLIPSDVTNEEEARRYDINNVKICNYFERMVSFYPEVIEQYQQTGMLTDCESVFFDDEYCMLRMNREFGHVKINGVDYLEFSSAKLDANLLTGEYIIAPKKETKSYFLGINEKHEEDIEVLLSSLYSFLDEEKGIEIYLGMPYSNKKEISALMTVKEEYQDRIHVLYNYLVTVELLKLMDAVTEMAYETSKRYQYMAAILEKSYLPIDRTNEYKEKDIVKGILKELGTASVCAKKAEFQQEQQAQINRILD